MANNELPAVPKKMGFMEWLRGRSHVNDILARVAEKEQELTQREEKLESGEEGLRKQSEELRKDRAKLEQEKEEAKSLAESATAKLKILKEKESAPNKSDEAVFRDTTISNELDRINGELAIIRIATNRGENMPEEEKNYIRKRILYLKSNLLGTISAYRDTLPTSERLLVQIDGMDMCAYLQKLMKDIEKQSVDLNNDEQNDFSYGAIRDSYCRTLTVIHPKAKFRCANGSSYFVAFEPQGSNLSPIDHRSIVYPIIIAARNGSVEGVRIFNTNEGDFSRTAELEEPAPVEEKMVDAQRSVEKLDER